MMTVPPRPELDRHATHLRIGVVRATVRSQTRRFRKAHAALYSSFRVCESDDSPITIDVIQKRVTPWPYPRYEIYVNGRMIFAPTRHEQILPYVEWAMNWEVPRVMPAYLQLHASSLEINGRGVIFPGDSGSGKSTLALGLLSRGARYLCDEFAMIHSNSLELHPYPRAICLKRPSFAIAERLGIPVNRSQSYLKGIKGYVTFINPLTIRANVIGRACPIRHVIFPHYTRGATPSVTPITRAEAAFELHRLCFNLFGCEKTSLDVLSGMIRGAQCHRLVSGDIDATCQLVEDLVGAARVPLARTA